MSRIDKENEREQTGAETAEIARNYRKNNRCFAEYEEFMPTPQQRRLAETPGKVIQHFGTGRTIWPLQPIRDEKNLESLNAALRDNVEWNQAFVNRLIDENVRLEEALTRMVEKDRDRTKSKGGRS